MAPGMKKQNATASSPPLDKLLLKTTSLEQHLKAKTLQLQITAKRNHLLATTSLRLRRSLDPMTVMRATAFEVRHLFKAERVILYRFNPNWSGIVIAESVKPGIASLLGRSISDECFARDWVEAYQQGRVQTVQDIYADQLSVCHRDLLANMGIWAHILVPVLQEISDSGAENLTSSRSTAASSDSPKLWGFLAVHECSGPRAWRADEVEFLQKMSVQIAIAIQQAQLHKSTQDALNEKRAAERQLQVLNAALEQRVRERTAQFESANQALQREVRRRKRAERILLQKNELAKITFDSIGDGVVTTDAAGRVRSLNPVAQKLTGWSNEAAQGQLARTILNMVQEGTRSVVENPLEQALARQETVLLPDNTILVSRTGQEYAITDSASPIRNHQGEIQGAVMVFHDCTPARKLTQELAWQATHDALTGLANRREFERQFIETIALAQADDTHQHILCFLDLDQFKVVNDACGHEAGDTLLRQVASILQMRIRSTDTLARLGGDEFGLLLKKCSLDKAVQIAELLRQQIQAIQFVWEDQVYRIGVSIGITVIDACHSDMNSLLSAADAACYAAKAKGRNCIQVYQPDDRVIVQERGDRQWQSRIYKALEEGRFHLHIQPINPVSKLKGKQLAEVLLRLTGEERQLIMPAAFIPAAERYQLMPTLDRWVIQSFLDQYEAHLKTSAASQTEIAGRMYTLNLSGASLSQADLLPFLKTQLAQHHVPAETLCFEITETAAIVNLHHASQLITELKSIGCSFALDDFGSGMCSMNYLKNLPVDFLKIDGSFVQRMVHSHTDYAIVECFNRLSHNLSIETVAEWVEDDQTLTQLTQMGVDYVQGFGIAKPVLLHFDGI